MQIGVYGGSFDPPHVGHALVAGWLLWTGRVDEVWLVPAFAHAFDKPLSPFDRRVALCQALAADVDPSRIHVDAVEAGLPVPSYTLGTLEILAARRADARLRLVVGADVLDQVDHWHAWDEIRQRFPVIVAGRAGWPPVPGSPTFPDVSSTEIRRRLAAGEPVDGLVTSRVARMLSASL
ncbi:MAG: nicotinate-nicotinamide nucleotide adenylyltransferase [Deltaproteobacteria bacterium]|nr:nicotinate-nicotinamide nucleotide adenylyltransferase [Deltaproteobacteria bacterium]